jgi:hypothetical protein
MLNNITLDENTMKVVQFEHLDIEDLTDTRDSLQDFGKNCHEFKYQERVWQGVKYYTGEFQSKKGAPRQSFTLIPQGEWSIINA